MKTQICFLAAVCCLVSSAAFTQDVTYNFMPGTKFYKYHTYKWMMIEGSAHPNQILDAEIRQSVDSQLTAKGFTRTDSDNADLIVGYQIAVDQEKEWNGYGMSGILRWDGIATASSSTIKIGTLVLDLYDPAAKQLVWTARATKTLDPSKNQAKNQKNLDKALAKLLHTFPPMEK
jgi:hypothetical protein